MTNVVDGRAPRWSGARRSLMVWAVSTALLITFSACGGGESASTTAGGSATATNAGTPQRGGTLKVASAVEPVSLDPALGMTDPGSQHAQVLIFDRLVSLEPGSPEVKPGLAESWELSDDKSSMTFHLREAKFSDGSPVTAADVKFSLSRASDEKVNAPFGGSLAALIESISTPDARTVVLHFDGPQPAILPYLAFAPCSIVSEKTFKRIGAKRFAIAPVDAGSGPFKLVKWNKGKDLKLVRNPHYWRQGLPYLDGVDMLLVPDDNTRLLDLRSGRIDIADDVPYSQLESIKSVSGIKLQVTPVAAVYGPWLSASGPLEDVKVRQALNYATPKDVIKKVALQGVGEISNSFIPPMKYWDKSIPPYPLDVAKAKELIASSDQAGGFSLELLVQNGDAVSRQTASILQDAWKEIGVDLKIQSVDTGTLYSRLLSGNFNALLAPPTATSSDIPSEDEFAINMTQPTFEKIFSNVDPKLRELIKQINGTWDEAERRKLFSAYQRQQLANPVVVPLVVSSARTALRDNVEGFGYILMNWLYLDRTWIKK